MAKRITELEESQTLSSGDYIMMDNVTNGVSKYNLGGMTDNYVSKSGGTMTGAIDMTNGGFYDINSPGIDADLTSRESIEYNTLVRSKDVNGRRISYVEVAQQTNGRIYTNLVTSRYINGAYVYNMISLGLSEDGTKYVEVTDPDAWCNGIHAVNRLGDSMTGALNLQSTNVTSNTTVSASTWANSALIFRDSENTEIGRTGVYFNANGDQYSVLKTSRVVNGTAIGNEIALKISADGTRSIGINDASIWRKALGFTNSVVTTITSVIAVNTSNATISAAKAVKYGNIVQVYIAWKNLNAISVPASGNITNFTIGTLAAGYRPAIESSGYSQGDNAGAAYYTITTGGAIGLAACEGTGAARTIAADSVFSFYVTFIAP